MCIYRITFYHRKINSRPGIYTQKFVFVTLAHAAVHFVKSIYNCKISIRSGKTNIHVYIRIYKRNPLSTHFISEKKPAHMETNIPVDFARSDLHLNKCLLAILDPFLPLSATSFDISLSLSLSLSHVLHITNSLSLLALGTY